MALAELEQPVDPQRLARRGLGTVIAMLLVGAVVAAFLVDAEPELSLDASPAALQRAVSAVREAETIKTDGSVSVKAAGNTFGIRVRSTGDATRMLSAFSMDITSSQPLPIPKHIEMVGTATHIFVRRPSGPGWIGAPSGDLNAAAAQFGADQNAFLAYLDALAGAAEPGGTERIRGVAAQRFDVRVESSKLPASTAQQKASIAQLSTIGLAELPMSIWLDEDGRLRRLVLEIKAEGVESVTKVDYYDYDEPVDIEAPPAAEVEDAGSVEAAFAIIGLPYVPPSG